MRLLIIFTIFLLFSCQNASLQEQTAIPESHTQMVAMLDSLNRVAFPIDNYQLNSRRVKLWRDKMGNPEAPVHIEQGYWLNMVYEMLGAGHLDTAIYELTQKIKEIPDKTLYDMLAVAYLRLGERQNCVENHTSASCIVPLAKEGWHSLPLGSQSAIQLYERILKVAPDDLQSRYLLNIAYMTLGQYPLGVPEEYRIPLNAFTSPNPGFPVFRDVAIPLGLDISGLSGGVAMEDFNNDGHLDLFITSYGMMDQARLFLSNGDGSFRDATEAANLKGIVGGLNVVHADYNNDGWADILILRGGWLDMGGRLPNSLLRNNGDGTFSDVTIDAGLLSFRPTQTAAWGDFNGDGWLDLFIGNETRKAGPGRPTHPCELYLNNGDGTFINIAASIRLNLEAFVKGCAWGDVDNDGRPDLYLSILGGPNRLYMNRGGSSFADWRFEETALAAGVQGPDLSFPTWFFDYDNDGWLDIFVSGYDALRLANVAEDAALEMLGQPAKGETMRLYRNKGDNTFEDVTAVVGLNKTAYAMGANFGDLDNDGWLDFYLGTGAPDYTALVPNRMFRNLEGKGFEEVTMNGFGHLQKGHGIAFGDLDNDGDQDIYAVMGGAFEGDAAMNVLYENPGFPQNSWLSIRLEGANSNRSAIGARIKVSVGGRNIYRMVGTGGSFGANPLQQTIGLGKASGTASVEIVWPGGERAQYDGVALNQFVSVKEGEKTLKVEKRKQAPFKINHEHAGHKH
jgi:hypothetical protein